MFDILGIIAFLILAVSFAALILSVFNRRMNQKLWIIILAFSAVLLIGSYYLDMTFGKEKPIKIDYSNVKLDPTPTPTPSPTPTPAPTPMVIEKKTKAPVSTAKPIETQKPAEPVQPSPSETAPQEPVAPPSVPEQPPAENMPSENIPPESQEPTQ